MSEIGHSTLLKFFVNTSKMSEQSGKPDSTITSQVPGEQALRGGYIHELQNEKENDVAIKEYSVSPVIKVTKEESTFTKGDLKVEKVIVSEDISVRFQHLFKQRHSPGKTVITQIQKLEYGYKK